VELVRKLPTTQDMCKTLVDFALKNGSKDNISVLVLKFS
jgi:serine/threonine protein phosphatase PrpC